MSADATTPVSPTRRKRTAQRKRPGSRTRGPDAAAIETRRKFIEKATTALLGDAMAPLAPATHYRPTRRPDMLGNNLWMLRRTDRRPRTFETPDDMAKAINSYFEWVVEHPLFENKVTHHMGEQVDMTLEKPRAMTVVALCLHLGIAPPTFNEYASKGPEFSELIARTKDVIYVQKFEGAAAELFSTPVIIRDLGLKDRTDVTSDGEGVTQIIRRVIDDAKDREGK